MSFMLRKLMLGIKRSRCANCGKPIVGKGFEWRGKVFCSKRCKREYRGRRGKRGKEIFLPSDTFEALYWRRKPLA